LQQLRLSTNLIAAVFAVLVALVIGAALGFSLRPIGVISGPTHPVTFPSTPTLNVNAGGCESTGTIKPC